jgi:hypothetical protein
MGIRKWVEEKPRIRSCIVGSIVGLLLPLLYRGYELTVLLAVMMPGVYWGFAFVYDGTIELLYETIIMQILLYVYLCYSLPKVQDGQLFHAPLAVFLHGIIDFLHHFRLPPSSRHVDACCSYYPVFCGFLDFGLAATMSLYIWLIED